jgi:hypothetical protein
MTNLTMVRCKAAQRYELHFLNIRVGSLYRGEISPWVATLEGRPGLAAAGFTRAEVIRHLEGRAAATLERVYREQLALRHANGGPAMVTVLKDALSAWAEQFDGPQDEDLHLSGADLIEWFTSWRLRAREALKAAGVDA